MTASFWSHRALCAGLVAMLATSCASEAPTGPREGQRAPSFSVGTIDGSGISIPSEEERPSLVVFWASWCGPCRREAVEVAEIVRSYGDRVGVFSINSGEDPTKVKLTAREWGMTWPVGLDPKGAVSRAFEVDALPLVVVLDRDGMIRFRGNGLPSEPHRLLDGLGG
ncbi:MAG: hypothetical protein CL927_09200 [Deltaproteobacteria bacterium]|nr:hypothetical protein [Deltaproteobacteria bacterium]HCH65551.1 hypothetical protein [Deltaproteobacteria bacterium]